MAQRPCDSCGRVYEAKTVRSRFCCSSCRSQAHRARHKREETPSDLGVPVASPDAFARGRLSELTWRRLELAGRDDHELGVLALMIAQRLETETTANAVATLSKEYRAVLQQATDGGTAEVDPLDELAARRGGARAAR